MKNEHLNPNPIEPSKSFPPLSLFGLLWGLSALSIMFLLPLFYAESLKWSMYRFLYQPINVVLLLAPPPFLMFCGLNSLHRDTPRSTFFIVQKTIAAELLFFGFLWLIADSFHCFQSGWIGFKGGVTVLLAYPGFPGIVYGPLLMAAGYSWLLFQRWRNQCGVMCTTFAYLSLLALGLYRVYIAMADTHTFSQTDLHPMQVAAALGILTVLFGIVGTLLMEKKLRIRVHLTLSFPIWTPFFVLAFFSTLLVDTTLYLIEEFTGKPFQPTTWQKILLGGPCLLAFPILLFIDFLVGLTKSLGQIFLETFFSPSTAPSTPTQHRSYAIRVYGVGLMLLFTLPIWGLPLILYGGIRVFVYESMLLYLPEKHLAQKSTQASSAKNSSFD